jgi:RNA polymerase sigma factor (TIGR02999 family)
MVGITQLLAAIGQGDKGAAADLFEIVYNDLRSLAAQHLAREDPNHTLQPTALVHEVYLRLLNGSESRPFPEGASWANRVQFFATAAQAMRRILIESARSKSRLKRGGGLRREPLDPDQIAVPELADELLALDSALTKLAAIRPKIAELVTLRYFGGMTIKEAADSLGIAHRTADAHWAYARAWLLAEMQAQDEAGGSAEP